MYQVFGRQNLIVKNQLVRQFQIKWWASWFLSKPEYCWVCHLTSLSKQSSLFLIIQSFVHSKWQEINSKFVVSCHHFEECRIISANCWLGLLYFEFFCKKFEWIWKGFIFGFDTHSHTKVAESWLKRRTVTFGLACGTTLCLTSKSHYVYKIETLHARLLACLARFAD